MIRTKIPSKLTEFTIKHAKPKDKPYKLSDGGGLYLMVNPSGSKYWRMKYRYRGKEKTLSIGVYNQVKLSTAREVTQRAREELAENKDPSREKKLNKLKQQNNLFKDLAEEWWNKQQGAWTDKHAKRVWSSIKKEMIPVIGNLSIYDITTPECLDVIRKVEKRGALDVATRVKQQMTRIFGYAINTGLIAHNPVIHLTNVIKVRKVKHMKSLPIKQLPVFLNALENSTTLSDVVRYGIHLNLLTFVRPGEIRFAAWEDFDLENREWHIPKEKTKMKREHIVPLSSQAIVVLEKIKSISKGMPYVFPGYWDHQKPISENALNQGIQKTLKFDSTAHGFRSLASTILNEFKFNSDWVERQLAHVEQNKVRGAYNRYEFINERKPMMQWWADYLDKQKIKGR